MAAAYLCEAVRHSCHTWSLFDYVSVFIIAIIAAVNRGISRRESEAFWDMVSCQDPFLPTRCRMAYQLRRSNNPWDARKKRCFPVNLVVNVIRRLRRDCLKVVYVKPVWFEVMANYLRWIWSEKFDLKLLAEDGTCSVNSVGKQPCAFECIMAAWTSQDKSLYWSMDHWQPQTKKTCVTHTHKHTTNQRCCRVVFANPQTHDVWLKKENSNSFSSSFNGPTHLSHLSHSSCERKTGGRGRFAIALVLWFSRLSMRSVLTAAAEARQPFEVEVLI